MHNIFIRWLIILLCVLGSVAASKTALGAAVDKGATEQQLKKLTERLNELSAWMGNAQKQRNRWVQEVAESDREVAGLSRGVAQATDKLNVIATRQTELASKRRELEQQRAEQARRITEHLAAAYRLNGQDYVKLVLNQESPETIERMMLYHRYFSNARLSTLDSYQQTLASIEANQTEEGRQYTAQAEQQKTLQLQQVALQSKRSKRMALLAELETEVISAEDELARIKANQQRLTDLLAELQRRSQELDGSQFSQRKGRLPWPINAPLLHTYGNPRSEGRLVWHGLVFKAKAGTPVNAVARGRVVYSDWLRGVGLLTVIDHGNGHMTLYGQVDDLTKSVGDWVETGEVVAHAGNSGGKTDSGLYFEVRVDGKAKDPITWLARR
ncbi:MAG: peptidoglycan DD-metalloendopeptidase family protein [Proteobacteria bacterium]|nr:peptidoglycan DD-metalloendopeptidase family protein [Pseudomonadota bacterium]